MLRQVPATHRKGTWDEFNARHAADPSGWNETFAPIPHAFLASEGVRVPRHADPAVQKLMAFWLAAFRRVERDGRAIYVARFVSLFFGVFCSQPQQHLRDLRTRAGASDFSYDLSALTTASPGYRAMNKRWIDTALKVDFDAKEINRFFPEARH